MTHKQTCLTLLLLLHLSWGTEGWVLGHEMEFFPLGSAQLIQPCWLKTVKDPLELNGRKFLIPLPLFGRPNGTCLRVRAALPHDLPPEWLLAAWLLAEWLLAALFLLRVMLLAAPFCTW